MKSNILSKNATVLALMRSYTCVYNNMLFVCVAPVCSEGGGTTEGDQLPVDQPGPDRPVPEDEGEDGGREQREDGRYWEAVGQSRQRRQRTGGPPEGADLNCRQLYARMGEFYILSHATLCSYGLMQL